MIVIERDFMAEWVRSLRDNYPGGDDYETGYRNAMYTVEAMLALMPAYDLDALKALWADGKHKK